MNNLKGDAFACYQTYLALKFHFTKEGYDFFKFNGKVKASKGAFETRRDRYFFYKLSKHPDPFNLLLANMTEDPGLWIGNIVNDADCIERYKNYMKRIESLTYNFQTEIEDHLHENLHDNLIVKRGQHPYLLKQYIGKTISLETITLLQAIYNFIPYWNNEIYDEVIWPKIELKIKGYLPFLNFDKLKVEQKAEQLLSK